MDEFEKAHPDSKQPKAFLELCFIIEFSEVLQDINAMFGEMTNQSQNLEIILRNLTPVRGAESKIQ